jgi:hypothetical protein
MADARVVGDLHRARYPSAVSTVCGRCGRCTDTIKPEWDLGRDVCHDYSKTNVYCKYKGPGQSSLDDREIATCRVQRRFGGVSASG